MPDRIYIAPDARLDRERLAEFVKLTERMAEALRRQPILTENEHAVLAEYEAFVGGEAE